jgi:hypothetical protein
MNQFSGRIQRPIRGAQVAFQFPLDLYLESSIGVVPRSTFGKVCAIVKLKRQQWWRCRRGEGRSGVGVVEDEFDVVNCQL